MFEDVPILSFHLFGYSSSLTFFRESFNMTTVKEEPPVSHAAKLQKLKEMIKNKADLYHLLKVEGECFVNLL